nr:MAG TPA: Recombinase zinc beta ribbon domain [Caudoviricetes sp.]
MNLYFCTDDSHDSGLYVAAESRGKAKCMYCDTCGAKMNKED